MLKIAFYDYMMEMKISNGNIYFLMFQNAVRIVRALFDIMLRKNNPLMAGRFLAFSQMFEREQWEVESELRQFNILSHEIIFKLEEKNHTVHDLREMDSKEIGMYVVLGY